MAMNALMVNVTRRVVSPNCPRILLQSSLKKTCPILAAGISGKALRDKDRKKPAPFPYKEKRYTFFHGFFDRTTHRFDENSKIIVVDGPIAAGKTSFAKALAEDLDMVYVPEANLDMLYINDYNYDMRQLDPKLPESCRSYDIRNFCEDPNHVNAANFQILMYQMRYSQYVDALAHVLSTGQGVVMDRCVYSDFVFLEAMFKSKFISKGAHSVYYEIRNNTITQLMKPHLVIYLDVPVATSLERIKKRAIPHEVKSKVFTKEYLETMEENYKLKYLKEIGNHAELLIYDWSDFGDVEVVVEDIERIDFDSYEKHDTKSKDWRLAKEWDWADKRRFYTNQKYVLMNFFNVPRFDVPELIIDGHDAWQKKKIWYSAPGMKFLKGYNADMGDSGLALKTKTNVRGY